MPGVNPSNEKSQSGSVEPTGDAAPEAESSSTTENGSLISDLIRRRVPQVLAGYLGVTWTLFELMQWLTDKYLVSPYLGRAILFGLLMLLPAVILVTYRHGRPGPDQWTSLERWGTAANVLLALFVLGFAYGDVELGSMVKTVQAGPSGEADISPTRDTSSVTVRQVPKKEFRKRVSLFYFDEAEGTEADTSLRRVAPVALYHDLDQDNFVSTRFVEWHNDKLRERNYENGLDVPLALKREIAQWEGSEYILSGSVGRIGKSFQLTTRLHNTDTGGEIAAHTFEGEELFPLIDRASEQLKRDLQLPQAHRESVTDLPVTQVLTSSLEAAKHYAEGYHSRNALDSQDKNALEDYSHAAEVDSTFALAHASEGLVHWRFGQQKMARRSFRKARRHNYRLSESRKYWVETVWLSLIEQRLQEGLRVSERWTKLHPYDSRGWKMKASIHSDLLHYHSTLESYRNALEAFPKSKDLQFEVGEWAVKAGSLESGARHFTSLTEKYPEEAAGYQWLGITRWKQGDLDRAEEAFKESRRIDRQASENWISGLYQATGRFEKALENLRQFASEREADRVDGYRLLHHYWLTGRLEEANAVLDSLWNATVDHPDFHRLSLSQRVCDHHMSANGGKRVSRYVSHVRDFDKKYGATIPTYKVISKVQLGNCLAAAGSLEVAEDQLAAADSIVEQTRPILRLGNHLDYFMGRVQEETEDYGQAIDRYERFLRIHPGHSTSLIWDVGRPRLRLAVTYQKAGNIEKARKVYRNALALYPAHPKLNFHYGQFLAAQNEVDKARIHIRRSIEGWTTADSSFTPKRRARALLDSLKT